MIFTDALFEELFTAATAEQVQKRHAELLKSGKPIVLYGAGTVAVSTINAMRADGLDVAFVCDSNSAKVGQRLLEVEIISFARLLEIKDSVSVIITAGAVNEIHKKLNRFSVNHFAINHFALNREVSAFRERFIKSVTDMQEGIRSALPLFTDDESRGVLYNSMKHYMLLDYDCDWMEAHVRPNQYFYEIPMANESFVDIGAFDGDTFADFITATGGGFADYYGIEMDSDNYFLLQQKTSGYDNVHLFKYAVTNKDGVFSYKKTADEKKSDFALSADGGGGYTVVEGRTLDNLLANRRVTMLKADIEGAELDMLNGAAGIIKNQSPKCAVCVYHRPEHFWKVPLFLHKINSDYKFRLRMHQPLLFEIVCYAAI